MANQYDVWIAGAGYAGAVSARALAEKGKKVLVLERRDHIGGNAYDCLDDAGVLIHKYGPHIFHTNDRKVFDFLSRFTRWRDYQHKVIADIPGEGGERLTYPVPFKGRFLPHSRFSLCSKIQHTAARNTTAGTSMTAEAVSREV